MFVIKVGAYPSGAPLRWSTIGQAHGLTHKHPLHILLCYFGHHKIYTEVTTIVT